ncbi:GTP 3',8-cyclase MoaA, partial [Arthrobacter sp. NPDC058127]
MPQPRSGSDHAGSPMLRRPSGTPAGLFDRYGRRATDMRLSLTDKCNLRCTY